MTFLRNFRCICLQHSELNKLSKNPHKQKILRLKRRINYLLSEKSHLSRPDYLMRPTGLEPVTYGLEIRCSIQLSYGRKSLVRIFKKSGRGGQTRTGNPSLPKRVRYQLRHAPTEIFSDMVIQRLG